MCSSVCERARAFANVPERLRTCSSVCERLRTCPSVCERARAFASVCERARAFANVPERLRACSSVCERARAFASVLERLRACSSAPSRVWSRLVALNFFVFGHVWACSVVIFRHFSSFLVPKGFFSGMAGNGRLRHWLGREGSSLLRMARAPGARCASCHDIRFKLACNCGRAAAAFVRLANNCTAEFRSLQFLVFQGVHPRFLCVK